MIWRGCCGDVLVMLWRCCGDLLAMFRERFGDGWKYFGRDLVRYWALFGHVLASIGHALRHASDIIFMWACYGHVLDMSQVCPRHALRRVSCFQNVSVPQAPFSTLPVLFNTFPADVLWLYMRHEIFILSTSLRTKICSVQICHGLSVVHASQISYLICV